MLAILLTASQGWALTLNDVVKKVEGNYKNIVAFRGSFNQTATLKTLNKVQQAQGDLFYKSEIDAIKKTKIVNKFKWEYKTPTEQEIISDGKTLWMYFPENRQVYIYDLTETFAQEVAGEGQIPGNFLTSLGDLRRDFNVQWGTPRDRDARGNYIIELVPKRPMVNVRNIFLVVPKELVTAAPARTPLTAMEGQRCTYDNNPCTGSKIFPVLASTVYDSFGNMTNIEFADIEVLEATDETVPAKKRAWTLPDSMFTYLAPANVEIIKPPLTRPK
jgi:outer membrane lipoprotein carrier protein